MKHHCTRFIDVMIILWLANSKVRIQSEAIVENTLAYGD